MLLIGTMLSAKIYSQPSGELYLKKTGLLFGISGNQLNQGSLNNIVHKGGGFSLGFDREIKKENAIRQFEWQIGSAFLKSTYENEIASYNFSTSFSYRYLFQICCRQYDHGAFVGGKASADYHIEYFDNWDENHFYWMTSYSLGADLRLEYPVFETNLLQFEADIPLISFVSIPPTEFMNIQSDNELRQIIKTMHENPRISPVWKHTELNLLVKYHFQNPAKVKPALLWKCHYLNSGLSGSATNRMLSQTLGFELYF